MIALRKKWFVKSLQFIRRFSSQNKPYSEVSIPVPWGEIRGKWWGPTDIRPILTLHGWQDNCGSFDRLIPLLDKNIGFLAIDLPGHGYSSWLPPGLYYHFTTYLLTVQFIIEHFQWSKVSLMGHSMGGITCYTYAMLYPQNVDFLACFDGFKPWIPKNVLGRMSTSIDRIVRSTEFALSLDEPPCYCFEDMKKMVHKPNNGSVDIDCASYILERNIAPSKSNPGKYYFTRDPRLKSFDDYRYSQNELVEHAQKVTCPIFITKCKAASYYEVKQNFYDVVDVLMKSSQDCDFHLMEGTHHAHLNNPGELSGLLQKFIQRRSMEDRSISLKD